MDHIVLTVRDIEKTCVFYTRVLGMDLRVFGEGRRALHYDRGKINLHEAGNEFEPKAVQPTPESADLCFITTTAIADVMAHFSAEGVELLLGPVPRTGSQGPLTSVYFRDPDGNLIEVSVESDT